MTCFAYGRHGVTCSGRLQDHHIVKQQHISKMHRTLAVRERRTGEIPSWRLRDAIRDPRLQVKVCVAHHGLESTARLEVRDSDLPPGFWAAVREYGLEPHVPKNLTDPEEERMANCKSCGAAITWAKTATGRRMPLEPHENGNIIVRNGVVVIVQPGTVYEQDEPPSLYQSHFASCPNAKTHRKSR